MKRLTKMIDIAGLDREVALKSCLFKGMDRDSLSSIRSSLRTNSIYVGLLDNLIQKNR